MSEERVNYQKTPIDWFKILNKEYNTTNDEMIKELQLLLDQKNRNKNTSIIGIINNEGSNFDNKNSSSLIRDINKKTVLQHCIDHIIYAIYSIFNNESNLKEYKIFLENVNNEETLLCHDIIFNKNYYSKVNIITESYNNVITTKSIKNVDRIREKLKRLSVNELLGVEEYVDYLIKMNKSDDKIDSNNSKTNSNTIESIETAETITSENNDSIVIVDKKNSTNNLCSAITKKGTNCGKKALQNSSYCGIHKNYK